MTLMRDIRRVRVIEAADDEETTTVTSRRAPSTTIHEITRTRYP